MYWMEYTITQYSNNLYLFSCLPPLEMDLNLSVNRTQAIGKVRKRQIVLIYPTKQNGVLSPLP